MSPLMVTCAARLMDSSIWAAACIGYGGRVIEGGLATGLAVVSVMAARLLARTSMEITTSLRPKDAAAGLGAETAGRQSRHGGETLALMTTFVDDGGGYCRHGWRRLGHLSRSRLTLQVNPQVGATRKFSVISVRSPYDSYLRF
jgi:hypothetical protein